MIVNDDLEYVNRCLKGDRGAFEPLVEKYQKPIFNVALRMMRNADDAEDVAQAAFLKAYERLSSFDPQYKFFSWLYRIAVNEALNLINQRNRFESLPENVVAEEDDQEERAEADRTSRAIGEALMNLKVDQRAVIVLKHFQGFSYEEIGQILDISEKKVKSRLFVARQVLRVVLMKKGVRKYD